MAQILVADDSHTFRDQLRADLTEAGHEVIDAEDGPTAIESLRKNPQIQLVVLDMNMPGCSGLDVLREVSSEPFYENIIKFILTTESNPELKNQGKLLGVRAWITKPYNKDLLIGAIKKVLE